MTRNDRDTKIETIANFANTLNKTVLKEFRSRVKKNTSKEDLKATVTECVATIWGGYYLEPRKDGLAKVLADVSAVNLLQCSASEYAEKAAQVLAGKIPKNAGRDSIWFGLIKALDKIDYESFYTLEETDTLAEDIYSRINPLN